MTRFPSIAVIGLCAVALCSCGAMSEIKTGATKFGESIGNGFEKMADATTKPFRPGIPIAEPREKDMHELKTGREQAVAYQAEQQRRRGWFIFGGPVDFDEPALPEIGDPVDAGLLPGKVE